MQQFHRFEFEAMGCEGSLQFYAEPLHAQKVASLATAEVFRIQSKYSRFDSKSYLSKINHLAYAGKAVQLDDETALLMNYALSAYQKSDGVFDVTAGVLSQVWDFKKSIKPTRTALQAGLEQVGIDKVIWDQQNNSLMFNMPGVSLDFGGIGKEYAVDAVAAMMKQQGVAHGMVDIGGDISILGPHPDGEPWVVAIRHPRRTDGAVGMVNIFYGALATSGDYERYFEQNGQRYCHIIHPKTGYPACGVMGVSVYASTCLLAGTMATTAMLKAAQAVNWLEGLSLEYLLIDQNEKVSCSNRFQLFSEEVA